MKICRRLRCGGALVVQLKINRTCCSTPTRSPLFEGAHPRQRHHSDGNGKKGSERRSTEEEEETLLGKVVDRVRSRARA